MHSLGHFFASSQITDHPKKAAQAPGVRDTKGRLTESARSSAPPT